MYFLEQPLFSCSIVIASFIGWHRSRGLAPKRSPKTMATNNNDSKVEVDINASPDRVWKGLTEPADVKQYMMGAELKTDWKVGSPIVWRGEFKGKKFEDAGKVLAYNEPTHLGYTHISPASGEKDKASDKREVHIRLSEKKGGTHLELTQNNNASMEAKQESEKNWKMMLDGLKKVSEG